MLLQLTLLQAPNHLRSKMADCWDHRHRYRISCIIRCIVCGWRDKPMTYLTNWLNDYQHLKICLVKAVYQQLYCKARQSHFTKCFEKQIFNKLSFCCMPIACVQYLLKKAARMNDIRPARNSMWPC